jgi:hypothetical protein
VDGQESTTVARAWAIFLVAYLLIVGLGSATLVAVNFPTQDGKDGKNLLFRQTPDKKPEFVPFGALDSPDQALVLLALLAGAAGSFLHAAQSLSSYLGNRTFKTSWVSWYFLRPWIGAILGFAIYFALRTGLVAGLNSVNPYGVVALGVLGGWFSKTTTDKLQEVFETLFKTDADKERKDKLKADRPIIDSITPSPVPAGQNEIAVRGQNFQKGARVIINLTELQQPTLESPTELKVPLAGFARPPAGTQVFVVVKNPKGDDPMSRPYPITFS